MELREWSENTVNVDNGNFLKINYEFLSVIQVKWTQSVCYIIRLYSSTFYGLFLPFFVLKIFKFKYVRHSASISKFEWLEQPWILLQRVRKRRFKRKPKKQWVCAIFKKREEKGAYYQAINEMQLNDWEFYFK